MQVSHEVRTPASAIIGAVELLRSACEGDGAMVSQKLAKEARARSAVLLLTHVMIIGQKAPLLLRLLRDCRRGWTVHWGVRPASLWNRLCTDDGVLNGAPCRYCTSSAMAPPRS